MAKYTNRYKDQIIFNDISESQVEMSGFNNQWCRFGWENDYTEAYDYYMQICNSSKEPDFDLLIDDPKENSTRVMTLDEFIDALKNNEKFYPYYKMVKSDKNKYYMVDPSGGPYISLGSDLRLFFKDGKKRIVNHIEPLHDKIIFTVSN